MEMADDIEPMHPGENLETTTSDLTLTPAGTAAGMIRPKCNTTLQGKIKFCLEHDARMTLPAPISCSCEYTFTGKKNFVQNVRNYVV